MHFPSLTVYAFLLSAASVKSFSQKPTAGKDIFVSNRIKLMAGE